MKFQFFLIKYKSFCEIFKKSFKFSIKNQRYFWIMLFNFPKIFALHFLHFFNGNIFFKENLKIRLNNNSLQFNKKIVKKT
jgi:hypothetical protein